MADNGAGIPNNPPCGPEFTVDGVMDFLNSPPIEDLTVQEPIFQQPPPISDPMQDQDPIFTQPHLIPEQENEIGINSNIPFQFTGGWNMNVDSDGFPQPGPSENPTESTNPNQFQFQSQSGNFNDAGFSQEPGPSVYSEESSSPDEFQVKSGNYENTVVLSQWPPTPVPFSCSCCQVLREIFHTNGMTFTTLELHGSKGKIFHGILDTKLSTETDTESHYFEMFDFTNKTMEEVKQFVIQYCNERKESGFFIINDPMSTFYETLCIGFTWAESLYNTNEFQPTSSNQGTVFSQGDEGSSSRVPLSIQRQRTGKMTLREVGNYFHLPIEQAAKRMRICPTVVKKICRRDGATRWPHRKINSLEKQMANWAALMGVTDPEVRLRALSEITRIQNEMDQIKTTGRRDDDNQNAGRAGPGGDVMMTN